MLNDVNNKPGFKQYVTKTPEIFDWMLLGPGGANRNEMWNGVSLYDPYIYAFTGSRGAGKDASLTLLAMMFLSMGIRVFLNYPMQFYFKREGQEHAELLKADLLDMDKWLNMDDCYNQSFIGISEFQQWDNAYRQTSTQSLIIHHWIDQIRKMQCSFGYTSKRLQDVGGKTVSETDFSIACLDVTVDEKGRRNAQKRGMWSQWEITDMSGYFTGRMGTPLLPVKQPIYQVWGAYNTLEKFDLFDALRGVRIETKKRVLGSSEYQEAQQQQDNIIMDTINEYRDAGVLSIAGDVLRNTLIEKGVDLPDNTLGKIIRRLDPDIDKRQRGSRYDRKWHYEFNDNGKSEVS